MHSFTPVFKGVARAVEVGVLYHHETPLSRLMLELLRAEGNLTVGANQPYAITDTSDYTVPVHGEGRGIPHVEIEIRQDLIDTAAGQQGWAERMARLLRAAGERLP
jgi:predicted N-formylglutamate amidohydrolase